MDSYRNNETRSLLVQSSHSWHSEHFERYRPMTRTDSRCVATRNLESNVEKFRDLILVEFPDHLRPKRSSMSCWRDLAKKPRSVWGRSREGIRRIGIAEIDEAEPEPVRTVQPEIAIARIPIKKYPNDLTFIFYKVGRIVIRQTCLFLLIKMTIIQQWQLLPDSPSRVGYSEAEPNSADDSVDSILFLPMWMSTSFVDLFCRQCNKVVAVVWFRSEFHSRCRRMMKIDVEVVDADPSSNRSDSVDFEC